MASAEFMSIKKHTQKKQSAKVHKVKKRLLKGEIKVVEGKSPKRAQAKDERGVVYVGHLPHGFYEKEMRAYFKQFGKVTSVRLSRSKSTGQSKGYAFVEFESADVAKIVAETMNNYLMNKKLLKAEFIPRDKMAKFFFRTKQNWTPFSNPGATNRTSQRLEHNKRLKEAKCESALNRKANGISKTLRKLKKAGIKQSLEIVDKPESLAAARIDSTVAESPSEGKLVVEIDESDEEVQFKIPPGAVTKILKRKTERPIRKTELAKVSKKIVSSGKKTKKVQKFKMGIEQVLNKK